MDLVNSKPIFKKNKLEEIENDIGIVYALRNLQHTKYATGHLYIKISTIY